MKRIYNILIIAICLILISFIYPIGLNISNPNPIYKDNGICFDCNVPPDYFTIYLMIILIPIIAIIGIIILFYPSKKKDDNYEYNSKENN